MKIKEWDQQIIFLHQVTKGKAGRSYGIHVAMLAGLPEEITNRAKNILWELEKEKWNEEKILSENDANLLPFQQSQQLNPYQNGISRYRELIDLLNSFQPDDLSPKEALNMLYDIHELFKKGQN